jgi:hypothetical protein
MVNIPRIGILTHDGSLTFKKLLVDANSLVPRETNIDKLDKFRKVMQNKEFEMDQALESPIFSENEKETIEIYLRETRQVIALVNARIDELNASGGRRKSSRRKSRRRKSRRRKSRRRKSRRRKY